MLLRKKLAQLGPPLPETHTPHPSHHPTLGHCKGDKIREKGNRRRKAGKGRTKMGDKR